MSGSSVDMSAASTTSSTQDWTPEQEGDVANAVAAGVLSQKLNMLYSTDQLVEFQYAPNGVPSDKCLANTASDTIGLGESVDLVCSDADSRAGAMRDHGPEPVDPRCE